MKRVFASVLAIGLLVSWAVAEDWNQPTLTSEYTDLLSILKARDESSAKMDYSSATNLPTGVIRWNSTVSRFELWNGSTWADLQPALTTHLNSTSNPHSVTAAQVGAPTTASFSAHTGNTSNPHSVTAGQAGALAAANNLSDLTDAATARSNLSVPSAAALTTHTGNTSNPHSVTAAQAGALAIANNLSEITSDLTARTNIGAAASGANFDITSLQYIQTSGVMSNGSDLNLISGPFGSGVCLRPSQTAAKQWCLDYLGRWTLPATMQKDYTTWPGWPTCTDCARLRSLNPSAATSVDNANAINTLYEDLIDRGILQ